MERGLQERLINWGYAVCDAAMRRHVDPALPRAGRVPLSRLGGGLDGLVRPGHDRSLLHRRGGDRGRNGRAWPSRTGPERTRGGGCGSTRSRCRPRSSARRSSASSTSTGSRAGRCGSATCSRRAPARRRSPGRLDRAARPRRHGGRAGGGQDRVLRGRRANHGVGGSDGRTEPRPVRPLHRRRVPR